MRVLTINSRMLRPLPEDLQNSACSVCNKRQARWHRGSPQRDLSGDEIVCGLCYLYETEWGEAHAGSVAEFVQAVSSVALDGPLALDASGKLIHCSDADRVLGSIALTSRMFRMQDKESSSGV
jgi:hypothetical protein